MIDSKKAQKSGTFMVLLGGLLCISVFTFVYINMLGSAQQSVPTLVVNSTEFSSFDKTSQITNTTNEMNDAFTSLNSSSSTNLDTIAATTLGGYKTLTILGSLPGVYQGIMAGMASIIGIPVAIVNLISIMIIGFVIALFILLVFRVYVA